MLEQETLDGNKLIADFCGYSINEDGCYLIGCREYFIIGRNYSEWCSTTDIKYDFTKKDDCNKAINVGEFYYNISPNHLLYHSSWDWLMSVVEKIESLGYRFDIALNEVDLYDTINADFSTTIKTESTDKISSKKFAVWLACIKFVKWYNLNKNETIKKQ